MEFLDTSKHIIILVVDDNHDQATITKMFLERYGFKVITRSNGKECIKAAQELKPDVIITDIDMPVMDGVTACRFIRQQQWGKHIPIIALSATLKKITDNLVEMSCFDAQFFKPAQYDYLANTILKMVNEKK
jgi:two-component system alkaline phosphatase synthesis response regulator PhoP